jgi:FkbM family methyltransferase
MPARFTTLKRVVRIATSPFPMATKRALLAAERGRDRDIGGKEIEVPIGSLSGWIAAESGRVDYFTMYGSLIDGHFSADVDGAAVLDIGAHKGYFALRCFAEGATRVHSYEPASQNLESLERSAAEFEPWRIIPKAVGPEAGSVVLHLAPGSWAHSVHTPVGGESVGTEDVEMLALSDVLAQISAAGDPVVVKINVEGAAGGMILGTKPADWDAVRLLWTDLEVNDPVGLPELVGHLESCGMRHADSDGQRKLFLRA